MNRGLSENKACSDVFPALSTTTLAQVRGFTEEVLFCLKEGLHRTRDIAERCEKSSRYVNVYLKRAQDYGLVQKNGSFWNLSEEGALFVEYLESVKERKKERQHLSYKQTTNNKHLSNTSEPKKSKQICLLPFLRNLRLPDAEGKVVEVLVKHYEDTGSKFIYIGNDNFDFAAQCGLNPQDLSDALANLHQDRRIYIVPLEGRRKLGLYDVFIEKLQNVASQALRDQLGAPSTSS